ncbi:Hypothetical predicted protein [Cloeon dipterum]|uniref:Uncharacterized protein n=1 Tax=Cloeon dipterum TaxID=197152 RepID=A0A8S1DTX4_9INSE|nr:Hypothetical predicted protein [Cloeon dipterum]
MRKRLEERSERVGYKSVQRPAAPHPGPDSSAMHTALILLAAAAASAAAAAPNMPQARRVWKRGAGGSWEQLALLASLNPYAALLGGGSDLLHADALGLGSAPPLYGANQPFGGGHHFGAGHQHFGGHQFGGHQFGGQQYGGQQFGGQQFGGSGVQGYSGLGLLNVAAAAPLAFNPYFARPPQPPVHAHRPLDPSDQLDKAISAYVNRGELLAALAKNKAAATEAAGADKAVNAYAQTAILSTPAPLLVAAATPAPTPAGATLSEEPFRPSQPHPNEPSRLSLYPQHQHMTLAVPATPAPPAAPSASPSLKTLSASYAVAPTASPRYPAATHPLFGAYGTAFPPPAAAAAAYRPHHQPY